MDGKKTITSFLGHVLRFSISVVPIFHRKIHDRRLNRVGTFEASSRDPPFPRSSKAFENPPQTSNSFFGPNLPGSCFHHHLPLKCLMLSWNLAIRVGRPMSNLMVGQHVVEHWQLWLHRSQPWLLSWHCPLWRLHPTLELAGGPDARRKAGGKRGGRWGPRGGHAADVGVTFKLGGRR